MLNWIRRQLLNRRRAIFHYWDGMRWRGIDPRSAYRALRAHPKFDPETHLPAVERGDLEAIDVTLEATRTVFGVSELSDAQGAIAGLTVDETLDLLGSFVEYLHTLKKNGSPPPISPEPTAPPFSEGNCEATNVSVDCGSTPIASNCAAPAPS